MSHVAQKSAYNVLQWKWIWSIWTWGWLLDLLSSSGNESPNESFIYDAEPEHIPGSDDSQLYAGSAVSAFQALILFMQGIY